MLNTGTADVTEFKNKSLSYGISCKITDIKYRPRLDFLQSSDATGSTISAIYTGCLFILSMYLVYLCLSPLQGIFEFSSSATSACCWFSLTATHSDSATVLPHASEALFSREKLTNRGMENTEMD